jgi:hypothetical protein
MPQYKYHKNIFQSCSKGTNILLDISCFIWFLMPTDSTCWCTPQFSKKKDFAMQKSAQQPTMKLIKTQNCLTLKQYFDLKISSLPLFQNPAVMPD